VAIPLVVLLPALLEEFGWRGFGIPALGRMPLLWAALLAGIPFTLIHLPLHMPGHVYADLPMWPSVLSLLSYSVILGWMFSASHGSALLAGLMHASANGAVPLTWGLDAARVWEMRGIAFAIVAVALVLLARRTFMRPARDVDAEPETPLVPAPAT
jgi:membrane protease YdiL (CAAX protease family)